MSMSYLRLNGAKGREFQDLKHLCGTQFLKKWRLKSQRTTICCVMILSYILAMVWMPISTLCWTSQRCSLWSLSLLYLYTWFTQEIMFRLSKNCLSTARINSVWEILEAQACFASKNQLFPKISWLGVQKEQSFITKRRPTLSLVWLITRCLSKTGVRKRQCLKSLRKNPRMSKNHAHH